MDLNKIKDKLNRLDRGAATKNANGDNVSLFWKPTAGKQNIRILPNFAISDNPSEQPFIPLEFYYDFGSTMLAPHQFDLPDPVKDFHDELTSDKKNHDAWVEAKPFRSVLRIYVPILVRGLEQEGVKFWGFGISVYNKLKALYEDEQWGCIHDLQEGVDLTVDFTPSPDKNDARQAKTEVTPHRKSTPAVTDTALLAALKKTPDLTKLFKIPTEDVLKDALTTYLNADEKPAKEPTKPAVTSKTKDVADVEAAFDELLTKGKESPSTDDLPF